MTEVSCRPITLTNNTKVPPYFFSCGKKILLQRRISKVSGQRNYTGMTSIFDVSSHLKIIPSRLTGNIHLAHWHPIVKGSGGGTIISTLSFLWTTPITLTVLPSLMYLQKEQWKSHKNILPTYRGSPQLKSLMLSPLVPWYITWIMNYVQGYN